MSRANWKRVGEAIANGYWGHDGISVDAFIKHASEQEQIKCLLAHIASRIPSLCDRLDSIESRLIADKPSNPVSDGAIRWLLKDQKITPEMIRDRSNGLSVRARKALAVGGFELVSDICPDRIRPLKNCGEATVAELMQFRQKYLPSVEG